LRKEIARISGAAFNNQTTHELCVYRFVIPVGELASLLRVFLAAGHVGEDLRTEPPIAAGDLGETLQQRF
jgi:hypothetical protein